MFTKTQIEEQVHPKDTDGLLNHHIGWTEKFGLGWGLGIPLDVRNGVYGGPEGDPLWMDKLQ